TVARPAPQDLMIDLHVFDVEGDVLLRLPLDLLVQLLVRHGRNGDLADDHALPGDAHGHVALADLVVAEQALQRLDHGSGVHHLAVDDDLRLQGRVPEAHQGQAPPALLQLTDLDRGGPDIDTDEVFSLAHASSRALLPIRSGGADAARAGSSARRADPCIASTATPR